VKGRTEIRVVFGDTDAMGVVYYANYLRWMEASRATFLRDHGGSYADFEKRGLALPVVEAGCRYKKPARYEDLVVVEPTLDYVRRASLRFTYTIRRDADVLAEGHTLHACIDGAGKLARLPTELMGLFA
jgi:acyl-CoA thioester hydrolase